MLRNIMFDLNKEIQQLRKVMLRYQNSKELNDLHRGNANSYLIILHGNSKNQTIIVDSKTKEIPKFKFNEVLYIRKDYHEGLYDNFSQIDTEIGKFNIKNNFHYYKKITQKFQNS